MRRLLRGREMMPHARHNEASRKLSAINLFISRGVQDLSSQAVGYPVENATIPLTVFIHKFEMKYRISIPHLGNYNHEHRKQDHQLHQGRARR